MSTRTPNFNLYKPDPTDDFDDFLSEFNDNMDEIDANLGGGGGSGGHTIIDSLGQDMPQRAGLQIIGASVTDDSVNDKTVVNITGGGGGSVNYSLTEQVIGTWIDGKPLYQISFEYHGNIPSNSTTVLGNATALSIETYVGGFGSAYESGWGWASFPESDIRLRYNETNGNIQISTQSIGFVNSTAYVTIWYTKTTD